MSVTGYSGRVMPSWFVWFLLPSFSAHKLIFLGLTAIHLTIRIARKTRKGCIELSIGLISSFPSKKLNTISLLNGLSLEVWVKAELYPSLQQSQFRNLLQACLRWALISPFEGKLQRFILAIPFCHKTHIINFFQKILTPFAKQIPIFWGHGKEDLQVDYEFSIKTAETLASDLEVPFQSYENTALTREELEKISPKGLRFHSYGNLGHWINEQELMDLYAWILFLLPDGEKGKNLNFWISQSGFTTLESRINWKQKKKSNGGTSNSSMSAVSGVMYSIRVFVKFSSAYFDMQDTIRILVDPLQSSPSWHSVRVMEDTSKDSVVTVASILQAPYLGCFYAKETRSSCTVV